MTGTRTLVLALAIGLAAPVGSVARAESTRLYTLEGFGTFLDGNPESTAITEDGQIALPLSVRERFVDAASSFSAAAALGGEIVLARTGEGVLIAVDAKGRTRELATLEETMVTAMLVVDDELYVAVAQPAEVLRVDGKGKVTSIWKGEAEYVWALAAGQGGALVAATGSPGTVVQIARGGGATVLFKSPQAHLRSLAVDRELGTFVGGGERGVVYRAQNHRDFKALYDSGQPEITALAVKDNAVYVAAVSGAEALAQQDANVGAAGAKRGKASGGGPSVRSALIRVAMDGTYENLAGSTDEAIFSLAWSAQGSLLVATGATGREDPRARLYEIETRKRLISMIYQSVSRRFTHLVPMGKGGLAMVAAAGSRVLELGGERAKKGEFFTLPFDTGLTSKFGVLELLGHFAKGASVTAAVRTGQTSEPDETWSAWSKEVAAPGGARPDVPAGRYMQLRITLTSDGKVMPTVHRVRLAYLRQNMGPFVREVLTLRKGLALVSLQREEPKSRTISLAEKPSDADRRGARGGGDDDGPGRARQFEQRGALTVRWVAEDPNGDDLEYDLALRPLGQADWVPVEDKLREPFYVLQSTQLPDGHYQFRVRATDAPANTDGSELSDTRESRAILIDNSPPRVDPVDVAVQGRRVTVRAVAVDAVGPLVSATYSIDGKTPRPMLPDDGLLDGAGETFTLRVGELASGTHTVTVRVVDEADNEGYGEATFRVP